jgi:hypothetical protein
MFILPIISASGVIRTVSPGVAAPGENVTVTLSVDVSGGNDYYAIDEIFPPGWTVIEKGLGSTEHKGHWKYVIIESAKNAQLTYKLQAPQAEGVYSFSGEYMFGGTTEPVPIMGQNTVAVNSSLASTSSLMFIIIAVLVVALAAVVYLEYIHKHIKKAVKGKKEKKD